MTRLIDSAGTVRVGIFDAPIDEVNYRDFELLDPFGKRVGAWRRHFAFNQFQFLGGLSDEVVFGCAIADVKYAGTAFAYVYDPRTKRLYEHSFQRPLARGLHFDQWPERGTTTFRLGRNYIEMTASPNPPRRQLRARLARGLDHDLAIDAVFSETDPPLQPMWICTPTGPTGWVYARKTAGHTVSGTLHYNGRTIDLAAAGVRGHHDWTAGYMRRDTFWNWSCLAGRMRDGRIVGMNLSCGVNETSFTENCFWIDGQLHKVDTVCFAHDRRDLMQPWRMSSYDGRVQLEFHPEAGHNENINAWIVASHFTQLVGRYHGTLQTAAGDRVTIDNLLGYAERHYAKW